MALWGLLFCPSELSECLFFFNHHMEFNIHLILNEVLFMHIRFYKARHRLPLTSFIHSNCILIFVDRHFCIFLLFWSHFSHIAFLYFPATHFSFLLFFFLLPLSRSLRSFLAAPHATCAVDVRRAGQDVSGSPSIVSRLVRSSMRRPGIMIHCSREEA